MSVEFWASLTKSLFMSCLSVSIMMLYLNTFLLPSPNKTVHRIAWSSYFVWQQLIMMGLIQLPAAQNLCFNSVIILLVGLTYGGKVYRKIAFSMIYISIWLLIEFLVGYILLMAYSTLDELETVGSLISKFALLVIVIFLWKFFGNDKVKELYKRYTVLVIVPLGSIFVAYTVFEMSFHLEEDWYHCLAFGTSLIMLFINILLFKLSVRLTKDYETKQINAVYRKTFTLYNTYYEDNREYFAKIRTLKHNLRNMLLYLSKLNDLKANNEISVFLGGVLQKENLFDEVIQSGNLVVDALVNSKYKVAQNHGIRFETVLKIPEQLPFDIPDLCNILGNALDNAIEAISHKNLEDPFIHLYMKLDRSNLIIVIKNSYDGNLNLSNDGKLRTRKSNTLLHGMGLESIRKSVVKYNGYMKWETQEFVFTLKILLYSTNNIL